MKGVITMLSFEMTCERYGGSRISRYGNMVKKMEVEASMPTLLKQFFDHFVRGKDCSDSVRKYIINAANETRNSDDYLKGVIGIYNDQYIVAFLNAEGLDTSAIKITYNDKDKKLFESFMSGCSQTAMSAFYALCLKLIREKQRVRLIKQQETRGVIYSTYPEEDIILYDGFITYTNEAYAKPRCNPEALEIISNAFERGVTYEEISEILPKDIEARFMNRELNEFEKAQLNALEHGIAAEA